MNEHKNNDGETGGVLPALQGGQHSFSYSLLMSLGLIYLTIPNLLFLCGWFSPWIAVVASCLILSSVAYAMLHLWQGARNSLSPDSRSRWWMMLAGILVAFISLYPMIMCGIVGFFETHLDYARLRQAFFCNLRDAAWPVVLPNGKEMTYYLASLLPPAALARVLPASFSQWGVLMWNSAAIVLSVLLLGQRLSLSWNCRGKALVIFCVLLVAFHDPVRIFFSPPMGMLAKGMRYAILCLNNAIGIDMSALLTTRCLYVWLNLLGAGASAYNSAMPAALAAALVFCCCNKHRIFLLPLVIALLAANSPLGCIGLMPMAAWLYLEQVRRGTGWLHIMSGLVPPLCMAFLLAVYFLRGDNSNEAPLAWNVWGWNVFGGFYARV